MSNFTCPTCGLTNIDCGKAGYKTASEIELEEKLKMATNTIEQVLKEPQMMDAGMLMFLTVQLNKIKE